MFLNETTSFFHFQSCLCCSKHLFLHLILKHPRTIGASSRGILQLTKGKPWPIEDEKQLTDWFNSSTKDLRVLAFSFDGKYSENAIYQKLLDLGLIQKEEETRGEHTSSSSTTTTGFTSSKLELPEELPSVEETLKTCGCIRGIEGLRTQKRRYFTFARHYFGYQNLPGTISRLH